MQKTFFLLYVFILFAACTSPSLKPNTIEIVPYFAGKDEVCLDLDNDMRKKVIMKVTKIIHEIDVYSKTDHEEHCTMIGNISIKNKMTKKSLSLSGSLCKKWLKDPKETVVLEVVDNHICIL